MVHKRYIKKNGKLIGPYYYESYRENGKVKKRYLGTVHPDELAKEEDIGEVKESFGFSMPALNLRNIVWAISILFVVLIAITLFLSFQGVRGLLGLETEPTYSLGDTLYGKAIVTLESGDYLPAGTVMDLTLFREGVAVYKKSESASEFFKGKLESRNLTDVRTVCDEGSSGGFCRNETIFLGEVFSTPGVYDVLLTDLIDYKLDNSGNYEILFSISSLNLFVLKKFRVNPGANGETSIKSNFDSNKGNTTYNNTLNFNNQSKNQSTSNYSGYNSTSITSNGSNQYCPDCLGEGNVVSQGQQCAYSQCYQGSRTKTCSNSNGVMIRESIPCVSDCSSDFRCDSWSDCRSGISYRNCIDINGCSNEVKESKECFSESCKSNVRCSEWGSCSYNSRTEDIINGLISRFGKQQRFCSDLNGCVSSYVEQKDCNLSVEIVLVREKDPCNDANFIIKAFEKGTNEPVLDINIQKWTDSGRLDINFIQNSTKYCNSCYNGIFDDSEEGLDCGGVCKPCKAKGSSFGISSFISINIIIGVISVLIIIFIFILVSIFSEKDPLKELRGLIEVGRTYLSNDDKANARLMYRKVQERYALLDSKMQREIKQEVLAFHADIIGFKIPD